MRAKDTRADACMWLFARRTFKILCPHSASARRGLIVVELEGHTSQLSISEHNWRCCLGNKFINSFQATTMTMCFRYSHARCFLCLCVCFCCFSQGSTVFDVKSHVLNIEMVFWLWATQQKNNNNKINNRHIERERESKQNQKKIDQNGRLISKQKYNTIYVSYYMRLLCTAQ